MSNQIVACLDFPSRGKAASELFVVQGWAFARSGSIRQIFVRHQPSGDVFPLDYPLSRPDVGAAFPDAPSATLSGFGNGEPILCRRGPGEMAVVAVLDDGSEQVVLRFAFEGSRHEPIRPPSDEYLRARRESARSRNALCVLFVDDKVPEAAEGRGYGRAAEIIRAMDDLGHMVSHFGMLEPQGPVARGGLPGTVEVLSGFATATALEHVAQRPGYFDCTLISRPTNFRRLLKHVDKLPRPVIYDAEGIWAEMDAAAGRVIGDGESASAAALEAEMDMARRADVVIAVSVIERDVFVAGGCKNVVIVSHAVDVASTTATFAQRRGMLFVGALQTGSPNADSIQWFACEISRGLADLADDQAHLTVVGPDAPPDLLALAGPRMTFRGKQPDLAPFMDRARIFVAPTRISSGISIKVLTAAAYGLPIVATSQLARELGWKHEEDLLVADAPDQFAACCKRLMQDEPLWQRVRAGALTRIRSAYTYDHLKASVAAALPARGS